jgi:hypothetical protein
MFGGGRHDLERLVKGGDRERSMWDVELKVGCWRDPGPVNCDGSRGPGLGERGLPRPKIAWASAVPSAEKAQRQRKQGLPRSRLSSR